ncbi:MAG: hypothetical protein AAGF95_32640, partial [Chloroflexota bacterium]
RLIPPLASWSHPRFLAGPGDHPPARGFVRGQPWPLTLLLLTQLAHHHNAGLKPRAHNTAPLGRKRSPTPPSPS